MAFQAFPTEAHFLTISQVTQRDGVWLDDRSQAFEVATEYLNILGMFKDRDTQKSARDEVRFTVLIAEGYEFERTEGVRRFYKINFTVSLKDDEFSLKKAKSY